MILFRNNRHFLEATKRNLQKCFEGQPLSVSEISTFVMCNCCKRHARKDCPWEQRKKSRTLPCSNSDLKLELYSCR